LAAERDPHAVAIKGHDLDLVDWDAGAEDGHEASSH